MSATQRVLVEGDDEEQRTRATRGTAMSRGVEVVAALAQRGRPPQWAPVTQAGERSPCRWTRSPYASADAVEAALASGWLVARAPGDPAPTTGPLAGLAVAVKDIVDVAGLPTRNGTPGGLWANPEADAPVWSSLAAAGARCVGKAATHEMAWGVTTPQIANPHAPHRIAGGSSGGSAACVAAGVARGALGTDTGGSVRIPAALCGVVGIRPTTGAVPSAGVTPLAPEQDVAGPIAVDVGTCGAMLEALLGRQLGSTEHDLDGMRIGILERPGRLHAEVHEAYEGALRTLENAGARLVPCETTAYRDAGAVSLLTMLLSSAREYAERVRRAPLGFGGEARALLTLGSALEPQAPLVDAARSAVRADTADLFAGHQLDAFVTPTVPCVAPTRGAEMVRIEERDEPVSAALTRFTSWASVTAMPAISVPTRSRGLPTAVQVMAPPVAEHVVVRIGRCLESRVEKSGGA